MIDAGFFAKRVALKPEDLHAAGVREICSVGECISPGPEKWFELWLHNDLGWFNRIADALRTIPAGEESHYRVFAYRIHPEKFTAAGRVRFAIPGNVQPEPIPSGFRRLGFDSANKTMESVLGLEHSPVSCNYMADELPVNEFCLFGELSDAIAAAERFAAEQPEPGDYYVVEVLEQVM
jgi:hypothetical protein